MENKNVIKKVQAYLLTYKSVDLKWFIADQENGLGIKKNAREIDIINQELINKPWFTNYHGHNPHDISIKYSKLSKYSFIITIIAGAIGLIGGTLGIISFFK